VKLFALLSNGPSAPCLVGFWLQADVAQLVEHHLAKVRVAGSNPVVRSKKMCLALGLKTHFGESSKVRVAHLSHLSPAKPIP
jgi:hypothetical protein